MLTDIYDDRLFCSLVQNDTSTMRTDVIRGGVSLIAGRNAGTILRASFRRHSLLDSESISSQLSVYCESIPRLRRPKTHIRAYGTSTYGAIHGLKIRVSAVQIRPCPFSIRPCKSMTCKVFLLGRSGKNKSFWPRVRQ